MTQSMHFIGEAVSRVDGPAKVTGAATYAAEFTAPDLCHGVIVSSPIAAGELVSIDTSAAAGLPGVIRIYSHADRPEAADDERSYHDQIAPQGSPFRPLHDGKIRFGGQPVALVVAETLEVARLAATRLRCVYRKARHHTDLHVEAANARPASSRRKQTSGRGDPEGAFQAAPVQITADYEIAVEHHNPMEPQATTVVVEDDGRIIVHDKTQGVVNVRDYLAHVFSLAPDRVSVVAPFVGGAFGVGLRPQYQVFLATMAALDLKRSVRVVMTRDQMFSLCFRPQTLHTVMLGAEADGRLRSIIHEVVSGTSTYETYRETTVEWSGLLYHCDNVGFDHRTAALNTATPGPMRAPGAASGLIPLECAMDELAERVGLDPIELRLRNYAELDENDGKPLTSKELIACYETGARHFGWHRRTSQPRSMRMGGDLVGYGMASGIWEAGMFATSARVRIFADASVEVTSATSDIGTGTYTILTQIAADELGLPLDKVRVAIGDSSLPKAPVEGGSTAAASAGAAVQSACRALRQKLVDEARRIDGLHFANASESQVEFADGVLSLRRDPSVRVRVGDLLRERGLETLAGEARAASDEATRRAYSSYAHSAVFAEVRVDEGLGVVRVARIVSAVAAGRILNPKTARSQILGGVVFGIGMALHEETVMDQALGRFMTHNLVDYHIPCHADVHDIEVVFVDERDDLVSPLGVKGVGEIGTVGTAAAIANAVYHATGIRVRDFPITLDKLMPR
jgi:xanthine dehydrogenase YagR molybdenum-binding subunit